MNRSLFLLLTIACVWSMSSCNFYRRIAGRKKNTTADSSLVVVKDSAQITVDTTVVRIDSGLVRNDTATASSISKDSAQQALLQKLLPYWNAQTSWTTFNGKAKAHIEGKGDVPDFTAHIRMEKGKAIWISVTALLNIEAARVLITPDTVQIQNKLQKEFRAIPFSEAGTLLPIPADFTALQNLIIGDVLQTGHQPTSAQDTADVLILSFASLDFTQTLQFNKADTSLHFQAVATPTSSMICEYGTWITASPQRFANNRNLILTDKADNYNLSLEFTKAVFNEPVEMPFTIPDKYDRK